jgi:hypothetical protein
MLKAVLAKADTVPLFNISPLLIREFNSVALALGDIAGLTFKTCPAAGASFIFMCAHVLCFRMRIWHRQLH